MALLDRPRTPNRPHLYHRWLLVLPFVWQVALVPAVNDVSYRPLDLPFPMVWQMLGVVFTTVVIAVVFRLDHARGVDAAEQELGRLGADADQAPGVDA